MGIYSPTIWLKDGPYFDPICSLKLWVFTRVLISRRLDLLQFPLSPSLARPHLPQFGQVPCFCYESAPPFGHHDLRLMIFRGAFKSTFWKKNLGFCPNWGGGSANPKFWSNFSKGVFVAIWRGFPSPNQQNHQKSHKKSSVTQKVWLFHEKIICLE